MVNTDKLMKMIDDKGIKLTHIAEVLGVTEKTLYNKINNVSQFTAREIGIMCDILNIRNYKTLDDIFFKYKVAK